MSSQSAGPANLENLRQLYIDLLLKSLTMWLWQAKDGAQEQPFGKDLKTRSRKFLKKVLTGAEAPSFEDLPVDKQRLEGRDWPNLAFTMIGIKRMENLRFCLEDTIQKNVPGDFIETGVWRGGATIFMRGVLKAYGITDRTVWVADSFEGLPLPDPQRYPAEKGDIHHTLHQLAVSFDEVKSNFERFGLLDQQVKFLKGWFKDTLPSAPIKQLAVMRLDGDMYGSTMDALIHLYPRLSVGGYVIIDDAGAVPTCKQAVDDFRSTHRITDPLQPIDWTGLYWQRTK